LLYSFESLNKNNDVPDKLLYFVSHWTTWLSIYNLTVHSSKFPRRFFSIERQVHKKSACYVNDYLWQDYPSFKTPHWFSSIEQWVYEISSSLWGSFFSIIILMIILDTHYSFTLIWK
jgi:hypothetical protein